MNGIQSERRLSKFEKTKNVAVINPNVYFSAITFKKGEEEREREMFDL